jgi:hypothetical protein
MRDRRWLKLQQSTSTQLFSCQGDYSTTLQIGNLRNPVKNCLRRYPKCLPRNSPKLLWASWWGEMFWPRAPFKPKKQKKTRPGVWRPHRFSLRGSLAATGRGKPPEPWTLPARGILLCGTPGSSPGGQRPRRERSPTELSLSPQPRSNPPVKFRSNQIKPGVLNLFSCRTPGWPLRWRVLV